MRMASPLGGPNSTRRDWLTLRQYHLNDACVVSLSASVSRGLPLEDQRCCCRMSRKRQGHCARYRQRPETGGRNLRGPPPLKRQRQPAADRGIQFGRGHANPARDSGRQGRTAADSGLKSSSKPAPGCCRPDALATAADSGAAVGGWRPLWSRQRQPGAETAATLRQWPRMACSRPRCP